jgi:hypothetical protein
MANRRDFIAAAGGAGLASMGGLGAAGSETEDTSNGQRDLYELRRYVIDHGRRDRHSMLSSVTRPSPR